MGTEWDGEGGVGVGVGGEWGEGKRDHEVCLL